MSHYPSVKLTMFALLALSALPGFAAFSPGTRHPDAPPETEQYAFLLGEWDCTIRSTGPNRWLASGALVWIHFDSEMVGDSMVMIGGEGRDGFGDYVDRNTFHNISDDHFDWRKDRSYDGGQTWIEGVATISAERLH